MQMYDRFSSCEWRVRELQDDEWSRQQGQLIISVPADSHSPVYQLWRLLPIERLTAADYRQWWYIQIRHSQYFPWWSKCGWGPCRAVYHTERHPNLIYSPLNDISYWRSHLVLKTAQESRQTSNHIQVLHGLMLLRANSKEPQLLVTNFTFL